MEEEAIILITQSLQSQSEALIAMKALCGELTDTVISQNKRISELEIRMNVSVKQN